MSSKFKETHYNFRSILHMKNIVRAFVVALALTGSAAYTQINMHQSTILTGKTSSCPAPMCMPNEPEKCGWK